MMKAIIFSRVSTMTQDLEQQEHALFQAAKSDGYIDKDIIVISEHESAVKNDISERLGLTKAKQAIEIGDVNVIYAFELSRIARRLDVFYDFRKFLIEHKVQLKVLNPKVNLLTDDGEVDENFSLVFSIFASLAEQEARLMKARFKRGKQKLVEQNKYAGAGIPFGYTVNDNKEYVINEEEAELVRDIYRMYNTMTIHDIAKEILLSGRYEGNLNSAQTLIRNILHRDYYTGVKTTYNGFTNTDRTYQFPAIISTEAFQDAQKKNTERRKYNKTKSKHHYLCRGLVRNINGELLGPLYCHNSYALYKVNTLNWETLSIKMDLVDAIALYYAIENKKRSPGKDIARYKVELQQELKAVSKKVSTIKKKVEECNDKLIKIETRYIDGKIPESTADLLSEKVQKEIDKYKAEEQCLEAEGEELRLRLINISKSGIIPVRDINSYSDVEKEKVVHEEIERITVIKGKSRFQYVLGIQFFNGNYVMIDVNAYSKKVVDESGNEVAYKKPPLTLG